MVRAQDVVKLQLQVNGHIDALNGREIEGRSDGGTFGAGAVVTTNIDDESVIEFAQVFHSLNDPANLIVGVGDVGAEYFRLMGVDLLLRCVKCVPLRQVIRPRSKLGVVWNDTEFLLVR